MSDEKESPKKSFSAMVAIGLVDATFSEERMRMLDKQLGKLPIEAQKILGDIFVVYGKVRTMAEADKNDAELDRIYTHAHNKIGTLIVNPRRNTLQDIPAINALAIPGVN